MAVLSFTSAVELDGSLILGSLTVPTTLTVTGDLYKAIRTIGAAAFDNIWTTGDGGLATFDVAVISVTANMWVELRNDHSGGAEFGLIEVTEDTPLILTAPNLGTSAATQLDGVALAANTEYGVIDAINVQNDGAASAVVTLTLID